MSQCRILNAEELKELETFLQAHQIELNNRTRRELSNVVPVAQLFKKIHTRLVDPQNYTSRNSTSLKLENWETFNLKVLRKLGLMLSRQMLELLAQGANGAIEPLLYDLMRSERTMGFKTRSASRALSLKTPRAKSNSTPRTRLLPPTTSAPILPVAAPTPKMYDEVEVLVVELDQLVDGEMQKVPQRVVKYDQYANVLRECAEKDNYIGSITQKSLYLESIIKVKEERISELMDQLGKLSVSILSNRHSLDNDQTDSENIKNKVSSVGQREEEMQKKEPQEHELKPSITFTVL